MFNISCHWFVFPLSFDVKTEVLLLPVSCQISIFSFYYYYYFFFGRLTLVRQPPMKSLSSICLSVRLSIRPSDRH